MYVGNRSSLYLYGCPLLGRPLGIFGQRMYSVIPYICWPGAVVVKIFGAFFWCLPMLPSGRSSFYLYGHGAVQTLVHVPSRPSLPGPTDLA